MIVQYEVRQVEPDITVGALTGQLNLGNRATDVEHDIKQRIQNGSRKFVLDLSNLTYIDSAGLGLVATCAGLMEKNGGRLVVVGAQGKIKQMFAMTRLDRVISLYPDFDSASAALSAPAAAAET
jgi:anti-anti-sigma factor